MKLLWKVINICAHSRTYSTKYTYTQTFTYTFTLTYTYQTDLSASAQCLECQSDAISNKRG